MFSQEQSEPTLQSGALLCFMEAFHGEVQRAMNLVSPIDVSVLVKKHIPYYNQVHYYCHYYYDFHLSDCFLIELVHNRISTYFDRADLVAFY